MNTSNIIKGIYDGKDFCLKFNETTVHKCFYDGKPEQKILNYCFEEGDEEQAEISRYNVRRTFGEAFVWITFNKVTLLEEKGVIDYHRNLPAKWTYQKEDDYEAVTVEYNGEIALMQISYQQNMYVAVFIINPQGVNHYYYRIMLLKRMNDQAGNGYNNR